MKRRTRVLVAGLLVPALMLGLGLRLLRAPDTLGDSALFSE